MSATELLFQHELVNGGNPLIVETGMDEIEWSYALNVAEYPTYGGEVVQILAVFIDDMTINGTIRSYSELEAIYGFFMEYFTVATQGTSSISPEGDKYTQVPMIMEYAHRGWRFELQPLEAPGFRYGAEVITPTWQMKAHVVDKSPDVSKLADLITKELVNKEQFALKGIISLEGGEPAQNPFVAPGVVKGDKFTESTAKLAEERIGKIGDYYHSLLPSYLSDGFVRALTAPGAKPSFGNVSGGEGNENESQIVAKQEQKEKTEKATRSKK